MRQPSRKRRKHQRQSRTRRATLETLEARRVLADTSFPAILQWFDGSYQTIERRAGDTFLAGYGSVYLPPTGRADSGDQSEIPRHRGGVEVELCNR